MSPLRSFMRLVALVIGGLCLFGSAFALLSGLPAPAFGAGVWGVILIAGVAFERWRYKPAVTAPGAGFEPTAERFIDTDTGRPVQVFVDQASGERRYVQS